MKVRYACAVSIRLAAIFFIIPTYLSGYFVPFLNQLSMNVDIWSPWLESGGDERAFPYGMAMLFVYFPSLIFSQLLEFITIDSTRSLEISIGLQMLAFEILMWRKLNASETMKKSINIFLFSPLIIWVNYFLGLNDFLPSACLFLASYLLLSHRYRSAGAWIGIAIGMKFSLALTLPFLILFAWDNPRFKKYIWNTFFVACAVGALFYIPGIYSEGFRTIVFNNKETLKAVEYFLFLGDNKVLVLPSIYLLLLYWLWKAGRISIEVLIAFFGISLLFISALSPASIGWMLWGLPLLIMNLAQEKKSRILLVLIQSLYLTHSIAAGVQVQSIFGNIDLPALNGFFTDMIFSIAIVVTTIWSYSSLNLAIQHGDLYKIADRPLTVSIAGDSGTGKDTLSDALKNLFSSETASILCGDDYHKYERGHDSLKNLTHLNPAANYLDLWARDYNLALGRKSFEQRSYDHDSGRFTQLKQRKRTDLVVSQGLHGLFTELSRKSDARVFLSMEDELRINLKIERDGKFRKQSRESILQNIEQRSEDYELYIAPQVKNSNVHFHLFEAEGQLSLKISSSSNHMIDKFINEINDRNPDSVSEFIELDTKVYLINSKDVNPFTLEEVLKSLVTGYNQLFLSEPKIPEGVLGVMVVLVVILMTANRQLYND
jgi:uridine kinase